MANADETDLHVRPLLQGDKAQWRDLWDGYNAFYGRTGDTALPAEIVEVTWSRFFDPDEPIHALVAGTGDRLLGLAHYVFHRNALTIPPTCYLQDLFARADARGRGVGRALIESVYERARAASLSRVYWHTHETNRTAMALYEKVALRTGFVVYAKDL